MSYETIRVTHEGAITRVTIDRPPLNAVSLELLEELIDAFDTLATRQETRCIVLGATGERAFSAGADLKASAGAGPDRAVRFRDLGRKLLDTIETHPKPVVSAMRGWCIGGGFAVAMACDIRLASTTAKYRTADAYIGVVPSWGMSLTRLVHFIGRNRSMDMLMLGEDISATQALELGLLTRVFDDAEFDDEVTRIAARLASGAPMVFRAIKEASRAQYWVGPEEARKLEQEWSERCSASEDYREGRAAFAERRTPVFNGT